MFATARAQATKRYRVSDRQLEQLRVRIAEMGEGNPWGLDANYHPLRGSAARCVAVVLDDPRYAPAVTAELAVIVDPRSRDSVDVLLDTIWELPTYWSTSSTGVTIYWPNVRLGD